MSIGGTPTQHQSRIAGEPGGPIGFGCDDMCARGCIACMRVRDNANAYVHIDTRTRTKGNRERGAKQDLCWRLPLANTSRSRRGANRTTIRNPIRLRLRSPPPSVLDAIEIRKGTRNTHRPQWLCRDPASRRPSPVLLCICVCVFSSSSFSFFI